MSTKVQKIMTQPIVRRCPHSSAPRLRLATATVRRYPWRCAAFFTRVCVLAAQNLIFRFLQNVRIAATAACSALRSRHPPCAWLLQLLT